jgi:hypothetical protein
MKEFSIKRIIVFTIIAIVQLILIGLKSFEIVDWDWCWIFAPIWFSYLVFILGMAIIIICIVLCNGIKVIKKRIKKWKNG